MAYQKREVYRQMRSCTSRFCEYEGIDEWTTIYHLHDNVYLYKISTDHKNFHVPSRKFEFTAEGETPELLLEGVKKGFHETRTVDDELASYGFLHDNMI